MKRDDLNLGKILMLAAAVACISGLAGFALNAGDVLEESAKEVRLDLAFVTHLDMNLHEQDVYIERQINSGEVYRVTAGDHDMNAPLYASATKVPHDPFNPESVGPFPKGRSLNLTLGQWLRQTGQGSLHIQGRSRQVST